jgi:hypothetical protein
MCIYWASVVVFLLVNGVALMVLLDDFNAVMAAVLIVNIVVFGLRALYAFLHRDTLFSEAHYRGTEAATNAERVGFYAFAVIIGAELLAQVPSFDDTPGAIGGEILLLIIVAPMVTYLTSGYGKFRDIVLSLEGSPERT